MKVKFDEETIAKVTKYGLHALEYEDRALFLIALCEVATRALRPEGRTTEEIWNEAVAAAILQCWRLEHKGKDDHKNSWMGNAVEAIKKLARAPQPIPETVCEAHGRLPSKDGLCPKC